MTQVNVCNGEKLLWDDSDYGLCGRKPKLCLDRRIGNKTQLHSALAANQYSISVLSIVQK